MRQIRWNSCLTNGLRVAVLAGWGCTVTGLALADTLLDQARALQQQGAVQEALALLDAQEA